MHARTRTQPGVVPESVERGPRMREIGSSVPDRVKPMTYKIYTCHFLAWLSDWLAQRQDNASEWG